MGQSVLAKTISGFGGKDSRDDDYSRPPIFCKDSLNAELSHRAATQSRRGYKGIANGKGGGGLQTYRRTDTTNRSIIEELISVDDNLTVLRTGSITVGYVGAETIHTLSIIPVQNVGGTYSFHCILLNGSTIDLDQDLGTGRDEAAPYALSSLITAINALADWTCSLTTGVSTGPAAFLPNLDNLYVGASAVINFSYWQDIFSPVATPFTSFWSEVNTAPFENASMQNCDDQLFIGTGKNKLYCYDSRACYRAGMPAATTLSGAQAAGGSLTALATYEYFITYEFTNDVQRVIEGDESNRVLVTLTGGNQTVDLTIPYILTTSGFLTHCGIPTSGGGVSTNVISGLTAGHCARVGDVIALRDYGTGTLATRTVTAVTDTTITHGGPNFAYVNNNPVYLSSGPKIVINIWRNAAGDTELKYLVATIDNDTSVPATTTVVYSDTMADATLIGNATYDPPVKIHSLPPDNLKYLTVYNTLLCGCTGLDEDVWFSDWDGPHYFPEDSSSFNIRSKTSSLTTGISATRELLCITKDRETHLAIGDLPNAQFRQELIADAIGCDAHASMALIDNVLTFWSDTFGLRRVFSSGILADWSYRVLPDWAGDVIGDSTRRFVAKRAVSVADTERQRILLFLPCEDGSFRSNANSRVYVCDYRDAGKAGGDGEPMVRWWPWDNINMQGGATIYNGIPYFMERAYSSNAGAMEYNLCAFLYNNNQYDFCDHAQPINFKFEGTWYHMDEPSILKTWLMAKLYRLEEGATSDATFELNLERSFINNLTVRSKAFTSLPNSSFGWGYGPWGFFGWGDIAIQRWTMDLGVIKSEAIKPIIENTSLWCQQIIFSGIEFELIPSYDSVMSEE